jgi:hypothetical protein
VVAQEQEPEPDLGDQERLRECDQVRDPAARLTVPVVRKGGGGGGSPRRRKNEECNRAVGR